MNTKCTFKESQYNIYIDLKNGSIIVYNTRTGAIIDINDKDQISQLIKFSVSQDDEYISTLYNEGFIVDSNINEVDLVRNIHSKYVNDSQNVKLTLLPTEACNMNCPYCFTYAKKNLFMQDWVYEGIYNYIKREAQSKPGKSITIEWFGGEPTLSYKKICNFMLHIKDLAETCSIIVDSIMLTNGLLLNAEMFKELYFAGIKTFQITVDGSKETHDKLRVTHNGEPTYDKIWSNLLEIKKLDSSLNYRVVIRSNFKSDSEKSLLELAEQFKTKLSDDKRFSIYFSPIYDFETERGSNQEIKEKLCSSEERIDIKLRMNKVISDRQQPYDDHINSIVPSPIYSWCSAEKNNYYIIGADGAIYSCATLIGRESAVIGQVRENGYFDFNSKLEDWKKDFLQDNDLSSQCTDCKLLPICMGGCPRIRVENKRNGCMTNISEIKNIILNYLNN